MIKYLLMVLFSSIGLSQEILTYNYYDHYRNDNMAVISCCLDKKIIQGSLIFHLYVWEDRYFWATTDNKSTPAEIYQIYPQPIHAVIMLSSGDDHSQFANLIQKAIKSQPITYLWFLVTPGALKDCSQLRAAIEDLKKIIRPDQTIGIYSGPQYWYFGSQCFDISMKYPLLYQSAIIPAFRPFGGFRKALYTFSKRVQYNECDLLDDQAIVTKYFKKV